MYARSRCKVVSNYLHALSILAFYIPWEKQEIATLESSVVTFLDQSGKSHVILILSSK